MILYKNDKPTRTKAKQDYAWAYIFHHSNFDSHNEGKQSKRLAHGRVLHDKNHWLWKTNLYRCNSQPMDKVATA